MFSQREPSAGAAQTRDRTRQSGPEDYPKIIFGEFRLQKRAEVLRDIAFDANAGPTHQKRVFIARRHPIFIVMSIQGLQGESRRQPSIVTEFDFDLTLSRERQR